MYYNIANYEPTYPDYLSNDAVSLLRGLLEKDPELRLGRRRGVKEIKKSKFFSDINFKNLL